MTLRFLFFFTLSYFENNLYRAVRIYKNTKIMTFKVFRNDRVLIERLTNLMKNRFIYSYTLQVQQQMSRVRHRVIKCFFKALSVIRNRKIKNGKSSFHQVKLQHCLVAVYTFYVNKDICFSKCARMYRKECLALAVKHFWCVCILVCLLCKHNIFTDARSSK